LLEDDVLESATGAASSQTGLAAFVSNRAESASGSVASGSAANYLVLAAENGIITDVYAAMAAFVGSRTESASVGDAHAADYLYADDDWSIVISADDVGYDRDVVILVKAA
jgi:hypothetical protein